MSLEFFLDVKAIALKLGRSSDVDETPLLPERVIPDKHYTVRRKLLELCRSEQFEESFATTEYYALQVRHGHAEASQKCLAYRSLLLSMESKGFDSSRGKPVVVLDYGFSVDRLDGTHRASVARFLGMDAILGKVVTTADVLRELSGDKARILLEALDEIHRRYY